ncbi:MAG: hypothetical protein ABL934_07065 [Lysobacteraceae bacterium]
MLRNITAVLLIASAGLISACKASAPEVAAPQAIVAGASEAAAPEVVPSAAKAPAAAEVDVARIVADVMRQQYPDGYDEKHDCWAFSRVSGGNRTEYCMRSRSPQWADAEGGKSFYFLASSASDINDDLRYAYGSVDSGLMGAFQVSIGSDGGWKLVSAEKAIDFGTAGACGCENASLVKLGRAYYGWMFTSGGMWQGIVVSNHEIVAPHDGGFKNLSAIPEIREEAQDVRYTVAVVDGDPEADIFPLKVEKLESGKKAGERIVGFDRDKWAYQTISDF